MNKLKDTDIQAAIGWVLRTGVFLSVGVVMFGAAIYIYRHGYDATDYRTFKGVPDFVKLSGVVNGMLTLHGRAIIQGGIILLIATPVIRVAFSAIGFVLEKDYLYAFITLLVLIIIFASMLTGHAG
ncbi:DUF1634 domain-containing protein [Mucilaginibacter corticis]|uniref:DUF1634 domain-containing protein n=1 Tax=Mucilaginibacter corticis TaxID=2597670 RepID=A0A556MSD8_9SPHI|nr:DUF1634 domain-containing protein [Mucilaginibacter corticis]TSJ42881.1 DUF1634 domain-containing protein [Mucilaginibacter corticis]